MSAAGTVNDLKQEKKAKAEIQKHYDLVEQKKQVIEYGNVIHYSPLVQQNIAFLGFHSKYMSAFKNGSFEIKRDRIGGNEVFVSIPIIAGVENQSDYRMKVCFRLKGTELYLSCRPKGVLTLQPHVKGQYISWNIYFSNISSPMNISENDKCPYLKGWEMWIVEKDEKHGTFAFKSKHNTYLCAERKKVVANRKKKKQWEHWRIIVVRDKSEAQKQPQSDVQSSKSTFDDPAISTKGGPSQQQPDDVTHAMVQNDGSYY